MPLHRFSSRKVSNDSSRSRDAGYASGGSVLSQMLSDQSNASATKKRKRMPKIVGGFACSFASCDIVFNRDGDRRKHEKNHSGQRKYVCERCGRGFLFPKDLKRHVATHAAPSSLIPESKCDALPSWPEAPASVAGTVDMNILPFTGLPLERYVVANQCQRNRPLPAASPSYYCSHRAT